MVFLNSEVCENTSEKESISPSKKHKAVIFNRGCGATVGFITGISVIPIEEKIQNDDTGNVLFAENVYREFEYKNGKTVYGKTNFAVEWISDKKLKVFYSESKQLNRKRKIGNIEIEYELMQ